MTFLPKVAVGFIVTFGFLCVNGINNAMSILIFSILCTAGVSLVMWIPLWWLVGWITFAIFRAIVKSPTDSNSSGDTSAPTKDPNQQALLNYIKLAKSKGFSDSQISTRLRVEGWSDAEIADARQVASENAG
ncbi:MAG: hypothetical protein J7647_29100 [Cyanobacteria bacterium SBLK]|nr:hypothetical protein [Cyanobacteria bacterium SBLK]